MSDIEPGARQQAGLSLAARIITWSGVTLVVIGLLWAVTYFLSQGEAPLASAGPRNVVVAGVILVVGLVGIAIGVVARMMARRISPS